jgi:hypothetical protein
VIQDVGIERAGPKAPVTDVPRRMPGSVRRTSTIDSARPDGVAGDVVVTARARDLHTTTDDRAVVLGEAGFGAVIGVDRVLRDIESADERLAALAEASVASGFRRQVHALAPDHEAHLTLLHLLLDDLTGASLVAGYALQRDPSWYDRAIPIEHVEAVSDQCAGWALDASILQAVRTYKCIPAPTIAPVPPTPDDPDAWHHRPPLERGSTRRARRLDLVADGADATLAFDAHFRDSYVDDDGIEGSLHEYRVRGRFDPGSHIVTAVETTAAVLPWVECPAAMGSAQRIVGTPVDDLRRRVRAELVGTTTCTHLNDVLRSLADLPALAAHVDGPSR